MDERIRNLADEMEACVLPDWDQMPELDLYMDQVVTYLKKHLAPFQSAAEDCLVTPSVINNYVKAGFVARPHRKKYTRQQLGTLAMACLLKRVMPVQAISALITQGGGENEAYYREFMAAQEEALRRGAKELRALEDTSPNESEIASLAMRFATRANVDRLIADRLMELTRKNSPK